MARRRTALDISHDERDRLRKRLDICRAERDVLAMLAAKGPAFDNPILAAKAVEIRDRVLRECGLNPDGTRLTE